MRGDDTSERAHARYERACVALERLAARLWNARRNSGNPAGHRGRARSPRLVGMAHKLDIAGIDLQPDTVTAAANALAVLVLLASLAASATLWLIATDWLVASAVFLSMVAPILARQAVLDRPAVAAEKRAGEVLKGSPGATNLMIMSLRHEPSVGAYGIC